MSAFEKLKNNIEKKEGYSEETARKVAAKIGDRKIGKEAMAKRAAASRKKHEKEGK